MGAPRAELIAWQTPAARWVMLATVTGSGLAFLDVTTVNVALPAIEGDLGTGIGGLQWVLNAYTLALAALIPLGGALADRFGRRRVFMFGVVWFAVASLLCALAPTGPVLAVARGLQGVGGALLTPGSLAILQASFVHTDRARAVGAWSGLSGIAAAIGPLVGGWLVDTLSWRWIFFINLPLAALVVLVAARHVPESRDPAAAPGFDLQGAVLIVAGLGGLSWALISAGEDGFGGTQAGLLVAAVAALAGFLWVQAHSRHPMLPLGLFGSRQFTAANAATLAVYSALAGVMFLLVIYLQEVAGYSALAAGAALLPVTGLMLLFSARAGQLAERVGPRWPMTAGPLVMAAGVLLLSRLRPEADYLTGVLPAVLVFGAGLALTVAPLTATVLAAVPDRHTGIASAVNNAISRGAGLVAVAVLPVAAGISGTGAADPARFADGFQTAMVICAAALAAGGLLAGLLVRGRLGGQAVVPTPGQAPAGPATAQPTGSTAERPADPDHRPEPRAAGAAAAPSDGVTTARRHHCAVDGPPLQVAGHNPVTDR